MSSSPAPMRPLNSTAISYRSRFDVAIRQAIITYDGERVRKWDSQAEGSGIDWIFKCSLNGVQYPPSRGILSIRHVPEGSEIIIVPPSETY